MNERKMNPTESAIWLAASHHVVCRSGESNPEIAGEIYDLLIGAFGGYVSTWISMAKNLGLYNYEINPVVKEAVKGLIDMNDRSLFSYVNEIEYHAKKIMTEDFEKEFHQEIVLGRLEEFNGGSILN